MSNGAKAMVWQAEYQPWGAVQSLSGPLTMDLRFPGQWFQLEAGLHYNWHRHYDPTLGRYTQPDPLGFVDGPSVYGYARNSPYRYVDSNGLTPGDILGAWEYCRGVCSAKGKMVRDVSIIATPLGEAWGCICEESCRPDSYENPGHHDETGSGRNNYNRTKETLPKNHKELWEQSRPDLKSPDDKRWTFDGEKWHRFVNDNNGNWHWNGSSSGQTASGQPRSIPQSKLPNWKWQ